MLTVSDDESSESSSGSESSLTDGELEVSRTVNVDFDAREEPSTQINRVETAVAFQEPRIVQAIPLTETVNVSSKVQSMIAPMTSGFCQS